MDEGNCSRFEIFVSKLATKLLELICQTPLQPGRPLAESVLRKRIAEIPDGSWSETNMIQGDENWKITVRLTKQDDRVVFDFTGTDKQAKRGINLP
jgi:hypothetical protein